MGGRKKKKETEAERLLRLYRETGIPPGVTQTPDILPEYGPAGIEEVFLPERAVLPPEIQVPSGPSTRITDPGARGRAAAAGILPDPYQDVAEEAYVPPAPEAEVGLLPDVPFAELEAKEAADMEQAAADQARAEEEAAQARIYGQYGEDIGAKRQRYLDALEEIQTKSRRLNMIAGFTGGRSQADAFTQAALERLDTMEQFTTDERLQRLGRGVYYDQDGNYDPPKSKREAYNRAIQFGASPDEASTISGGEPERASYVNWQYVGSDPNVEAGKVVSTRRGAGVGDRPDSGNWVRIGGTGEETYTSGEAHINAIKRLVDADDVMGAIEEEFLWIRQKQTQTGSEAVNMARAAAISSIWEILPFNERLLDDRPYAPNGVIPDEATFNERESELYAEGIRWVRVGSPDNMVLMEVEPPKVIPEEEAVEDEDQIGRFNWTPRFVREGWFTGGD
jgi:hypothetical protein